MGPAPQTLQVGLPCEWEEKKTKSLGRRRISIQLWCGCGPSTQNNHLQTRMRKPWFEFRNGGIKRQGTFNIHSVATVCFRVWSGFCWLIRVIRQIPRNGSLPSVFLLFFYMLWIMQPFVCEIKCQIIYNWRWLNGYRDTCANIAICVPFVGK